MEIFNSSDSSEKIWISAVKTMAISRTEIARRHRVGQLLGQSTYMRCTNKEERSWAGRPPSRPACKAKETVGCLKIIEDKSAKSRIQVLDARLIIAINVAPRREGWNPRLNFTARTKTRGLKLAPQHYCSTKMQSPKLASHVKLDAELEARVSQASPQWQNARPKACV